MAPVLFVTGTGTDVGKTYVTAGLVRALIARGVPVDVLKPVVSGFDPQAPEGSDPAVLLEALGLSLSEDAFDRISPWRFRAPLSPPLAARREGKVLQAQFVIEACRRAIDSATNRLLLIEGAGGVMSPVDDDHTHLDLIAALGAPVLLVAGSYLGTISHTLTAVSALRSAGARLAAIVVSESLGAPPLEETVQALGRLCPDAPILAVGRDAPVPQDLARRVEAAVIGRQPPVARGETGPA